MLTLPFAAISRSPNVLQHCSDSIAGVLGFVRLLHCVVVISGIVMAVTAGILFGLNFCPVIYMQQNPEQFPTASSNGKSISARYLLIDVSYF